jgi:hypothetical protein
MPAPARKQSPGEMSSRSRSWLTRVYQPNFVFNFQSRHQVYENTRFPHTSPPVVSPPNRMLFSSLWRSCQTHLPKSLPLRP